MGLYGGLDVDDIHTRKQLEVGQKILDYMGSTELIANLFRISQTEEKLRNESRIRYLERMLKTAVIVEDESKEDEIGLNNTVEVYCEDDEEVETYRIVTSVRGSSLNGLVSIESPLGKALLGHKEGDRVFIKVNDDFGYYVIVKKVIKTQSEDEDHIRSF